MTRPLSLVCVLFALFAMVACSKDDEKNDASKSSNPTTGETSSRVYEPREMVQAIAESPYVKSYVGDGATTISVLNGALGLVSQTRFFTLDTLFARKQGVSLLRYERNWKLKTLTFTYRSLVADGRIATLSGRVTFPVSDDGSPHKVSSLSIYVHHFISRGIAPSQSLSPLDLRALFNSAVIEPDLQGYGASENLPYCGLSFDVQGRQIYDCAVAALKAMSNHGVTLADDGYTTCWGYSVSTPAIMGFLRLYDEQLTAEQRQQLRVRSSYVGGAPMLIDRIAQYMDQNPDFNATLIRYVIPFIYAMPSSVLGSYQLKDFLPDWMQYYIVDIDGTQSTFYQALLNNHEVYRHWPEYYPVSVFKNSFAADMFGSDGRLDYTNAKTQFLMNLLHHISDWGAWMPSTEIYLTHGKDDDRMPIDQARVFYESKAASGHIHWKEVGAVLVSLAVDNTHMAHTISSSANMMLYSDPATVFRIER